MAMASLNLRRPTNSINNLPDEILDNILSSLFYIPNDMFDDLGDVSPFFNPEREPVSALALVCRRWLRICTPRLYEVVVIRSRAQAEALANTLRKLNGLGLFVKKLRIEGGFGSAMKVIISATPNITELYLRLDVYSDDSVNGLCCSLPMIQPERVIVADARYKINARRNELHSALCVALSNNWKALVRCNA
jgi:hypothetical protein